MWEISSREAVTRSIDVAEAVSERDHRLRRELYDVVLRRTRGGRHLRWLEVDVECGLTAPDPNFFEYAYPVLGLLTATVSGEATHLAERVPNLTVVPSTGLHLPFTDGAFDVAICARDLTGVPGVDRRALVSEMRRVSERCFLATPSTRKPFRRREREVFGLVA